MAPAGARRPSVVAGGADTDVDTAEVDVSTVEGADADGETVAEADGPAELAGGD
jgi:hypothetical protein